MAGTALRIPSVWFNFSNALVRPGTSYIRDNHAVGSEEQSRTSSRKLDGMDMDTLV